MMHMDDPTSHLEQVRSLTMALYRLTMDEKWERWGAAADRLAEAVLQAGNLAVFPWTEAVTEADRELLPDLNRLGCCIQAELVRRKDETAKELDRLAKVKKAVGGYRKAGVEGNHRRLRLTC